MEEHVLCQYSSVVPKQENPCVIYDFLSQVSYCDASRTKKVIDSLGEVVRHSTEEISSVEMTNKGNYSGRALSSVYTESVENSDVDNLRLLGATVETRGTETSDADSCWKMFSTITTFATETSDEDN